MRTPIHLARLLLPTTFALVSLSLPLLAAEPPDEPAKPVSPLSVDDVLWWLPEDTETVLVSQVPFTLQTWPLAELPRFEQVIPYLPVGPLVVLDESKYLNELSGRSVSFVLEGSRRFREPKSEGFFLYEGCHILVFEDDPGAVGQSLMASLSAGATRNETLLGQSIAIFEKDAGADHWTIFLAEPRPNVLLCATNRDYLTEVLTRLSTRAQTRALPPSLPEWPLVDRTSRFWAIRHYDRAQAEVDPTSPFSKWPDRLVEHDSHAVGLVVLYAPEKDRTRATIIHLSEKRDGPGLLSKETTLPNDSVENTPNVAYLLTILIDLGHAMLWKF